MGTRFKKTNRKIKKNAKSRKIRGGNLTLPTTSVIPLNTGIGTNNDPQNSLISSRLITRSFFGGKKHKNRKNRTKSLKSGKKKGGSTLLNNDPLLGSRYNMNAVTSFGSSGGSFWGINELKGTGNDGGAQLSIQNRPVPMV
jgi:hypothetical protein